MEVANGLDLHCAAVQRGKKRQQAVQKNGRPQNLLHRHSAAINLFLCHYSPITLPQIAVEIPQDIPP
jgi:hypothetical protein